jgi:cob(I)alamin adenosyltransferase
MLLMMSAFFVVTCWWCCLKIYTKKGDAGETTTLSGVVVRKDDLVIEVVGLVDECVVGLEHLLLYVVDERVRKHLLKVVEALFLIGAEISNTRTTNLSRYVTGCFVSNLEKHIDEFFIPLKGFYSFRTIKGVLASDCRVRVRALERVLTPLYRQERIRQPVFCYINRLSDYLFVLGVYLDTTL